MKKTVIEKAFICIMEERIHQVAREKAANDPEYTSADVKRTTAFNQLRDALTTKTQRTLLDDLEGAWIFTGALLQEFAYRQGIEDSFMIHQELKKFGILIDERSTKRD
ncbi:hypothetical protein [Halalkalibacterium halodurans]|uniref:hypothetical protein n=1 Tax=Halalkalibacterium halodurans TaxID=86665 RepID=UPI0010FE29E0|nr:hypothetical protein [Halalkalibacterium halodurans]